MRAKFKKAHMTFKDWYWGIEFDKALDKVISRGVRNAISSTFESEPIEITLQTWDKAPTIVVELPFGTFEQPFVIRATLQSVVNEWFEYCWDDPEECTEFVKELRTLADRIEKKIQA